MTKKKRSKTDAASLDKLLERARRTEGVLGALAKRAELSARILSGAVRDLERLMTSRTSGTDAPDGAAAKRTPARKPATKRTVKRKPPAVPKPEENQ